MLPAVRELNCERDIKQETHDLAELVREFDELFELCEIGKLTPDELRELDDLYAYLQLKEEEFWGEDVDPWLIFMIGDNLGIELPALHYYLGLLAN